MAAMMPLKLCQSTALLVKQTAPPPLVSCPCIRFMSPMHTARIALPDWLSKTGIEIAHLLWSVVVSQPRSISRMYTCLMLRDSYCD